MFVNENCQFCSDYDYMHHCCPKKECDNNMTEEERNNKEYRNYEYSDDIICPYCGKVYTPSYEDLYIGDSHVDCYPSDTKIYTCDECGKKFELSGEQKWHYHTNTIKGQATYFEAVEKGWC